ncbi:MAG: ABC transporter ATP-binding protein, partial [Anaerolineales bacterium]
MNTVSLTSISKSFGKVRAVDDVSFEVYPGEIFGLLGPNGAGKTTAIRIMLDIFKPDSGQVSIFAGKLDESRKRRIGYMPEDRGLYKDLKLEPTLIFLATLKGLTTSEAQKRLDVWLERLDLYEHRHKKIQELSKGM